MNEFEGTNIGSPTVDRGYGANEDRSLRDKAGGAVESGKDKVKEIGAKAQEQAISKADTYLHELCGRIDRFADRLEQIGSDGQNEDIAGIAKVGSRAVRRVSGVLAQQSTEDLLRRARYEVNERPVLVIAGMAAVGFLGARLLKG